MISRRLAFGVALVVAGIIAFQFWPRTRPSPRDAAPSRPDPAPAAAGAPSAAPAPSPATAPAPAPFNPADYPIAARLNAVDSSVARDLEILQHLFDAWRTNFARAGNPVGENAEITAALTGGNPLGLALVPKNHPAINPQGELCDRWGTPFRFHQLSGERMEIRSAGPDRKFATADDALWTPP